MAVDSNLDIKGAQGQGSLLVLALLAFIVGAGAGLVGALFRLALKQGEHLRNAIIGWAHGEQFVGSYCWSRRQCGGGCHCRMDGSPILAGRSGQRHPSRRVGAARESCRRCRFA